jgi:hypothetical protein
LAAAAEANSATLTLDNSSAATQYSRFNLSIDRSRGNSPPTQRPSGLKSGNPALLDGGFQSASLGNLLLMT